MPLFDEDSRYKINNHFFFSNEDDLAKVCNAPKDGSGVYIIYALARGKIELVYIGSSGKMQHDGRMKSRKGGLYDRIVNGKQFGEARKIAWAKKLEKENIDALDIYWYETYNRHDQDIPAYAEGKLLQEYFDMYGRLPTWNKEF